MSTPALRLLLAAGLAALLIIGSDPRPLRAGADSASSIAPPAQALAGFWDMAHSRRPPGPARPGGDAAGGPPGGGGPRGPRPDDFAALQQQLQPWALERLAAFRAELAAGEVPATNANQCLPWAIPGNGLPGGPAYSMNIVVTPQQLVFMYQVDHQARIVYLNQEHPSPIAPSYFGHSVGHWEGDTLVIDSVGFNEQTKIHDGIPHTGALHVIERLRLDAHGVLEVRSTLEDPGAFRVPLVFTESYVRGEPFQEYVCAENNREAQSGAAP